MSGRGWGGSQSLATAALPEKRLLFLRYFSAPSWSRYTRPQPLQPELEFKNVFFKQRTLICLVLTRDIWRTKHQTD
jgi:hypothetical protein